MPSRTPHLSVSSRSVILVAVLALAVLAAPAIERSAGLFTDAATNDNAFTSATLLPPTGVAATDVQQTEIEISWTLSASAFTTGYEVHRALASGGPYALAGAVGGAATSFVDTLLDPNTDYFYVVYATFANWTSAPSNEAPATTLP